jgi:required for meiotic nuclear division protein 1
MPTPISLVSISLPSLLPRHEIEIRLERSFKKGIEKAFYAEYRETYLIYTPFNVLTFINWDKEAMLEALQKLDVPEAHRYEHTTLYQDYPIYIDASLPKACHVTNESITLKEASTLFFIIIALVISQSVGLEKHEQDLEKHFARSRQLLDMTQGRSLIKRSKLAQFAKELTFIRHAMLTDLFLLDKPNILWDNAEAEDLYNRLASILELKDRFEIVAFKLNNLKEDITRVLNLINHKHSEFLEWIIIILIGIEIVVMTIEFFKH